MHRPAVTRAGAATLALLVLAACTRASPAPNPSTPPASQSAAAVAPPAPLEPANPLRTRFAGRIVPLPEPVVQEMRGSTWEPACPVGLPDLRLLRFNYWGFDGELRRGPMVLNVSVAADVLSVFRALFDSGFPLKHVALAQRWRPNGPTDTTRSVTAAFNCRPALNPDGTPTGTWSQHAFGLAVDVNPLQNPYVAADGTVLRPAAEPYTDRSLELPGMIHQGDVVVRVFAAIGWNWGGEWTTTKDYMHFSLTGR